MASSVPAAFDYLLAGVRALPAVIEAEALVDAGFVEGPGDTFVVIGLNPEGDEIASQGGYSDESGGEIELVDIPCLIGVFRAGEDAERQARSIAFRILDELRELLAGDRTLGGAVQPSDGRGAQITGWSVSQTSSAEGAGSGRVCEIRLTLSWQHRV